MMSSLWLTDRLQAVRRRVLAVGLSASAVWGVLAAVLFLAACMWLDLLLELSASFRAATGSAAMLFGAAVLLLLAITVWRQCQTYVIARRMDDVSGTGGVILTGINLLRQRARWTGVTSGLAELAIRQAGVLAYDVEVQQAASARPAKRAASVLGVSIVAVMVFWMAMPRLMATQWDRFTDPYGDHPPYSRVTFEVRPGHTRVVYGDSLELRAQPMGGVVDRVDLVLQSDGAAEPEVLPMFPETSGWWRVSVARVTAEGHYFVRAGRARSRQFAIRLITVPRLAGSRLRITPPSYTHHLPYEGPLPQGGVSGLPGTNVDVWIASNRPLGGGNMRWVGQKDREPVEMTPVAADANEVHATFSLDAPGKIRATVVDVAGQRSRDKLTFPIAILSDHQPFVRLLEPKPVSLATPDVALPVVVAAEDDYGISRLQLFRNLNDSRALPMDFALSAETVTRSHERLVLPLSEYGLRPGDEIKLFARVEDNDPSGAKGAESPVVSIKIISQTDYQKMLLRQRGLDALESRYAEAQRRLEAIAEAIRELQEQLQTLPSEDELSEDARRRLERLVKKMEQEAQAIAEAADKPLPLDLDQALSPELRKMADALRRAAQQLEQARRSDSDGQDGEPNGIPKVSGVCEALKKAGQCCSGQKKELEEHAVEPVEYFAKIYPLLADEARFLLIYERQKDLAERLSSLRGQDEEDDPQLKVRMRDLEAEQHQIREDLGQLLKDIKDHVTALPEDERLDDLRETASKFADDVGKSGAAEAMRRAEEGLAVFSGTTGADESKTAEEILSKLISRCQGMGQGAGQCLKFQPTLSAGLGATVSQLLADAGLSTGTGGVGAGSGFSASPTTLQNVGLYGQVPLLDDRTRSGRGDRAFAGVDAGDQGDNDEARDPWAVRPTGELHAAGAASAVVPPRYRSRVGAYFQRIADEAGQ